MKAVILRDLGGSRQLHYEDAAEVLFDLEGDHSTLTQYLEHRNVELVLTRLR